MLAACLARGLHEDVDQVEAEVGHHLQESDDERSNRVLALVAVRYQAAIDDFVGLDPMRHTSAARGAITQATAVLPDALRT